MMPKSKDEARLLAIPGRDLDEWQNVMEELVEDLGLTEAEETKLFGSHSEGEFMSLRQLYELRQLWRCVKERWGRSSTEDARKHFLSLFSSASDLLRNVQNMDVNFPKIVTETESVIDAAKFNAQSFGLQCEKLPSLLLDYIVKRRSRLRRRGRILLDRWKEQKVGSGRCLSSSGFVTKTLFQVGSRETVSTTSHNNTNGSEKTNGRRVSNAENNVANHLKRVYEEVTVCDRTIATLLALGRNGSNDTVSKGSEDMWQNVGDRDAVMSSLLRMALDRIMERKLHWRSTSFERKKTLIETIVSERLMETVYDEEEKGKPDFGVLCDDNSIPLSFLLPSKISTEEEARVLLTNEISFFSIDDKWAEFEKSRGSTKQKTDSIASIATMVKGNNVMGGDWTATEPSFFEDEVIRLFRHVFSEQQLLIEYNSDPVAISEKKVHLLESQDIVKYVRKATWREDDHPLKPFLPEEKEVSRWEEFLRDAVSTVEVDSLLIARAGLVSDVEGDVVLERIKSLEEGYLEELSANPMTNKAPPSLDYLLSARSLTLLRCREARVRTLHVVNELVLFERAIMIDAYEDAAEEGEGRVRRDILSGEGASVRFSSIGEVESLLEEQKWRETEFMHALEGISTDKTMKTFFGNTLTRLCDSSGRFFLYDIACRRLEHMEQVALRLSSLYISRCGTPDAVDRWGVLTAIWDSMFLLEEARLQLLHLLVEALENTIEKDAARSLRKWMVFFLAFFPDLDIPESSPQLSKAEEMGHVLPKTFRDPKAFFCEGFANGTAFLRLLTDVFSKFLDVVRSDEGRNLKEMLPFFGGAPAMFSTNGDDAKRGNLAYDRSSLTLHEPVDMGEDKIFSLYVFQGMKAVSALLDLLDTVASSSSLRCISALISIQKPKQAEEKLTEIGIQRLRRKIQAKAWFLTIRQVAVELSLISDIVDPNDVTSRASSFVVSAGRTEETSFEALRAFRAATNPVGFFNEFRSFFNGKGQQSLVTSQAVTTACVSVIAAVEALETAFCRECVWESLREQALLAKGGSEEQEPERQKADALMARRQRRRGAIRVAAESLLSGAAGSSSSLPFASRPSHKLKMASFDTLERRETGLLEEMTAFTEATLGEISAMELAAERNVQVLMEGTLVDLQTKASSRFGAVDKGMSQRTHKKLVDLQVLLQRVSESLETEDKWEQKKGRKGSSSTQDHLLCRWSGRLEYVRRYRSCLLDSLSREAEELRLLRQSQATALSACLLGLMHPSLSFSLVLGRRPAEDKQSNSTLLSRAGRAMTNLSLKHQPLRNRSATEGALGIGSSQFYPFSLPLTLAQVHELASEDIDSAEYSFIVELLRDYLYLVHCIACLEADKELITFETNEGPLRRAMEGIASAAKTSASLSAIDVVAAAKKAAERASERVKMRSAREKAWRNRLDIIASSFGELSAVWAGLSLSRATDEVVPLFTEHLRVVVSERFASLRIALSCLRDRAWLTGSAVDPSKARKLELDRADKRKTVLGSVGGESDDILEILREYTFLPTGGQRDDVELLLLSLRCLAKRPSFRYWTHSFTPLAGVERTMRDIGCPIGIPTVAERERESRLLDMGPWAWPLARRVKRLSDAAKLELLSIERQAREVLRVKSYSRSGEDVRVDLGRLPDMLRWMETREMMLSAVIDLDTTHQVRSSTKKEDGLWKVEVVPFSPNALATLIKRASHALTAFEAEARAAFGRYTTPSLKRLFEASSIDELFKEDFYWKRVLVAPHPTLLRAEALLQEDGAKRAVWSIQRDNECFIHSSLVLSGALEVPSREPAAIERFVEFLVQEVQKDPKRSRDELVEVLSQNTRREKRSNLQEALLGCLDVLSIHSSSTRSSAQAFAVRRKIGENETEEGLEKDQQERRLADDEDLSAVSSTLVFPDGVELLRFLEDIASRNRYRLDHVVGQRRLDLRMYARRVEMMVMEKALAFASTVEKLKQELLEVRGRVISIEAEVQSRLQQRYDEQIQALKLELLTTRARFSDYQGHIRQGVKEELNSARDDTMAKMYQLRKELSKYDPPRGLLKRESQDHRIDGLEKEIVDLHYEIEEQSQVMQKQRALYRIREGRIRAMYERECSNFKTKLNEVQAAYAIAAAGVSGESANSAQFLRKQLQEKQGELMDAYGERDELKEKLALVTGMCQQLSSWKVAKTKEIEELQADLATFEQWKGRDMDKEVKAMTKENEELKAVIFGLEGDLRLKEAMMKNMEKRVDQVQKAMAKEQSLKAEAYEKLSATLALHCVEPALDPLQQRWLSGKGAVNGVGTKDGHSRPSSARSGRDSFIEKAEDASNGQYWKNRYEEAANKLLSLENRLEQSVLNSTAASGNGAASFAKGNPQRKSVSFGAEEDPQEAKPPALSCAGRSKEIASVKPTRDWELAEGGTETAGKDKKGDDAAERSTSQSIVTTQKVRPKSAGPRTGVSAQSARGGAAVASADLFVRRSSERSQHSLMREVLGRTTALSLSIEPTPRPPSRQRPPSASSSVSSSRSLRRSLTSPTASSLQKSAPRNDASRPSSARAFVLSKTQGSATAALKVFSSFVPGPTRPRSAMSSRSSRDNGRQASHK